MKSVLFINRVYPPDEGATGQLLAELSEALARAGWSVSVIAGGGRTLKESQKPRGAAHVCVYRVRGFPFTRASNWRRALSYASLYPAILWRVLRLPRHDVVVTLTDPPLQLTLGPVIKIFKRSRLIHWAQDVYPELAEELGVLRKNGWVARGLRRLSNWALRRHDAIIAVGRCMKERLMARGVADEKIVVIPNWAVGGTKQPTSNEDSRVPFTVMYSGNFGLAHPFGGIVEAVKILEHESAPVHFVFAGTGAKLNSVREQLAGCRNVEFRDAVPLEKLHATLASADVHLACMSDELLGLVVPSKVYGGLAAGRPCIFLGPRKSEVAQLLTESGSGLVLGANEGLLLSQVLRRWLTRGEEYGRVRAVFDAAICESLSGIPESDFTAVFEDKRAFPVRI